MVTTSKSMQREVQIKHDLMTHKCNGLRREMSGLCGKMSLKISKLKLLRKQKHLHLGCP